MLVGDIICQTRELINDLPRGLNLPSGITIAAAVVASIGSTLPVSTIYRAKATFVNQFGETLATAESGVLNVGVNQGIQITGPLLSAVPGATKLRIYFGSSGVGSENQWVETAVLPITISAPGNPGIPPTRNTSFYPDIDGQRVSAFTLYRWLNEALEAASRISGGIPDITGIQTDTAKGMYEIPGEWTKLDHGWYDGRPIVLGGKDDLFYRNRVPGFVGVGVLQVISNRVVIELQPQPSRTGGATTLNGAITDAASSVTVNDASGYKISLGLAIIGDLTGAYEIVQYSQITGTALGGLIRGLGGSQAQAWPDGTPIVEANCRLSGVRVFNLPAYIPGDAAKTLTCPGGWRTPLIDFCIARFSEATGNVEKAQAKMQAFTGYVQNVLRANKIVAGPRQIGLSDGFGDVVGVGSGGGWIVP